MHRVSGGGVPRSETFPSKIPDVGPKSSAAYLEFGDKRANEMAILETAVPGSVPPR